MGLFEQAKAMKMEEQKRRSVGYESSIMMTVLYKALVSRPLTGLQRRPVHHRSLVFTQKLDLSLPVNNH